MKATRIMRLLPNWFKRLLCWRRGHVEDIRFGIRVSDDGKFVSPIITNTRQRCGHQKCWIDEAQCQPVSTSYSYIRFILPEVPQVVKFN